MDPLHPSTSPFIIFCIHFPLSNINIFVCIIGSRISPHRYGLYASCMLVSVTWCSLCNFLKPALCWLHVSFWFMLVFHFDVKQITPKGIHWYAHYIFQMIKCILTLSVLASVHCTDCNSLCAADLGAPHCCELIYYL